MQVASLLLVVPYIGTWIETIRLGMTTYEYRVVPYIGTWIETPNPLNRLIETSVVPYIGTWIETLRYSL